MSRTTAHLAIATTLIAVGVALPTAALDAQPPVAPPTCEAPEHRQFDFWIGDWTVRNPAGAVVGTSRIESVLGGCAIVEHWTGAGPSRGTSLNFHDRATQEWSQTWIDNAGRVLRLRGGLRNREMVLEGTTPGRTGGATARQRITWTPLEEGNVRQLWETSTDDGATWTVAFDGRYSRKAP